MKKELIEYMPFGEYARKEMYGSSSEVAWFYFTGKPLDDETGLYYYGARYYDPSLGRFITPDTFVQSALSDPQTLNRYSYAGNNPVNRTDPTGHFWKAIKKFFKKFGDFISPLGRAIVTGDWKNFGYQVLNIATMVFAPNPWIFAAGALSYTSRATSHIGGKVANEISSVLGYAALGASVVGTGIEIKGAFDSWRQNQQAITNPANAPQGGQGPPTNGTSTATDIVRETEDATGTYGKFRLSVKRGSGSSGMGGSSGDSWGHAWISHQKGDGPWTSNGFWPGEGAGKEAIFGTKYSGVLTEVNGLLDSGISKADVFRQWSLSQGQYDNLIQYINNFKQNTTQWSLCVNCTDFATGAARSIGVQVPNVNTGPFQDPNKLGNWLSSGQ